ncbi:NUDIX hydrolase [bacterium]|jgi:8-oxo-dGTP pyrophosphatase MutT (NUDIX family)|nr:NUDIX hydrolase [bacterium]
MKNQWIPIKERFLHESPSMQIVERTCQSSEDSERQYRFYLLRSRDWCNIIPITAEGKVVMVKQHRLGVDADTLEIPGGVCDSEDSDHQTAAIRELIEETGYAPEPGAECLSLGFSHPNPAIQNNRVHSFIVGPVKKKQAQNLDPGEMIEVVEVPLEEIPQRIVQGEITHSLMLNTFFYLLLKSDGGFEKLRSSLASFSG